MGAKRALIVDDSKSARLFLSRMLEKYEVEVDSAESAESALEYLAGHRPDVIFMDHQMPGMDGLQAVQAIKSNPLTATIPIMMYTSQEGELYVGQARALGAVGVLPKQIKPTDVSKVLYELHLLADRRSAQPTTFQPTIPPLGQTVEAARAANDSGVVPRLLTESALREQFVELRRTLAAGLDAQADRVTAEVRALLLEAVPPPLPQSVARERQSAGGGWLVASVALLIALGSATLWWQQLSELRALGADLARLRADIQLARSPAAGSASGALAGAADSAAPAPAAETDAVEPASATAGSAADARPMRAAASTRTHPGLTPDSKPLIVPVPYGADALTGQRLDVVRQLTDRLVHDDRAGVVEVKSFPGRFCLVGNVSEGYSLAPDETPFTKCDMVGNPSDDSLSPAQRMPLAFANLIGAVRNASHGAIEVQFGVGDAAATVMSYPQISSELNAGEWNRAGSANNRIEIRTVLKTSSTP